MWVWRDCTICFLLLNFLLCFSDSFLNNAECEIYGMNHSTRAYFTCIKNSTLPTLHATDDCRDIGRDWRVVGNRTVYICDGNKYKICDQGKWQSGDLLKHKTCTDPDNEELIVAYRSECVLLTRKKYTWDDAINACNNISSVQQWQIIQNISRIKQTFLERFLFEESLPVKAEVWIGLHTRGGRIRWNSVGGIVDFIRYVDPNGENLAPPEPRGECYATAAADTDRIGGGWRGRPCNNELDVLCQTSVRGPTPVKTTATSHLSTGTTPHVTLGFSTDHPQTITMTTKTSTVKTKATSQPSTGSTITSPTETARSSPVTQTSNPVPTSVTISQPTTTDRTGNATEGIIDSKTDTTWIYVVVAVVVTVVILVCAVLIFINRRRRRKSLTSQRTEAVEYSTTPSVNPSTPFVNASDIMYDEANCVLLKEKTTLYSHIHNTVGAQDSTYDTANHKGTQPSPTLNATYDRANFIRPEAPDASVYDVTRKQTVNLWKTEENPSSTYDHAFVTDRPN